MDKLNKFKLFLGCFLILIGLIGLKPLTKDSIVTSGSTTTHRGDGDFRNRAWTSSHVSETNYPILLGCLFLSGTFLIISSKNKE